MPSKYLREARECLDKVAAGERAKLDPSVRRGMIGELRAQGVEVYKERADAYVAQRYLASRADAWSDEARATAVALEASRADAWSDEARVAALEARRASSKAKESGRPEDHHAAAAKHQQAATMFGVGVGSGKEKDVEALASQQHHEKMAGVERERAASGPKAAAASPATSSRGAELVKASEQAKGQLTRAVAKGQPNNEASARSKLETVRAQLMQEHPGHPEIAAIGQHLASAGRAQPGPEHAAALEAGRAIAAKQAEPPAATKAPAPDKGAKATARAAEASAKASAASAEARRVSTVQAHAEAATAQAKAARANQRAGLPETARRHSEELAKHATEQRAIYEAKRGAEGSMPHPSGLHVMHDPSGDANRRATNSEIHEYLTKGTVGGSRNHSIAKLYADPRGNTVAESLSPDDVRAHIAGK